MLSKNRISEIRKLSQKKFREESGLFIVEGTKSVMDLLRSKLIFNELYATEGWMEKSGYAQLHCKIPCEIITEKELERISCLTTPQEVLAIAVIPDYDIQQINYQENILVLDGIRDPGNLGTIIRTADWFGIRQVVCSPDCVELTNPKTIQATMGSFSRIRVFYTDLPTFLSSEKIQGRIYGTFMNGKSIQDIVFQQNDLIIIGNEANGISPEVEKCIDEKIHIPSQNRQGEKAESLNASIAAAISMYELCGRSGATIGEIAAADR